MKLRIETIGLMVISLIASFSLSAQRDSAIQVHQFTLQQAVDYAMKNNVQVKNALVDVQIQAQTNREVTSNAYPQINGSGSFVYNAKIPVSLVPGDFFGQPGTFVPLRFGVKYNATGGIELNQILFDGQVFVGLQARKTIMDWAQKNVEVTAEMIKSNVHKVYYQLAASKKQIELLDTNIALNEKLLRDQTLMFKNGFAERLDVDKATVQLANAKTEKQKVVNQISNGYYGLKLLMGMPIRDSLVLLDEVTYEQVREGLLPVDTFKYSDRKEFQYAELGIRLNQYDIKRWRLSRIPTVSLNGYYNKNAQRNEFDFFKGGEWFSFSAITLRVNVPIFNGFSTRAKIDKAKLELQKSINLRENLKLSIDNDIVTATNDFRTSIVVLEDQQRNMNLALQVYNQTKKKYEMGTGSQTEIQIAQTQLQAAQTNYINALYDAIISRVDYLKAIGKL